MNAIRKICSKAVSLVLVTTLLTTMFQCADIALAAPSGTGTLRVNPVYIGNEFGYPDIPRQPTSTDITGGILLERPEGTAIQPSVSLFSTEPGSAFGLGSGDYQPFDFSGVTKVHIEFEQCDVPVSIKVNTAAGHVDVFGGKQVFQTGTRLTSPITLGNKTTNAIPLITVYCYWNESEIGSRVKIKNIWFSGDTFEEPDYMREDDMWLFNDMSVKNKYFNTKTGPNGKYVVWSAEEQFVYEGSGTGFTMGSKTDFSAAQSGGALFIDWGWDFTTPPDFETYDTLYIKVAADHSQHLVLKTEIYNDRQEWETSDVVIIPPNTSGGEYWMAYPIPVQYGYGNLHDASDVRFRLSDAQWEYNWGRSGYISIAEIRLGAGAGIRSVFGTHVLQPVYLSHDRSGTTGFQDMPTAVNQYGAISLYRPETVLPDTASASAFAASFGTAYGLSAGNDGAFDYTGTQQIHFEVNQGDVPMTIEVFDGVNTVYPFGIGFIPAKNTILSAPLTITGNGTNQVPKITIHVNWNANAAASKVFIKNIWFSDDQFRPAAGMDEKDMMTFPDLRQYGNQDTWHGQYGGDYFVFFPDATKVYESDGIGSGFTMGSKTSNAAADSGGAMYLGWGQFGHPIPDFREYNTLYVKLNKDHSQDLLVQTEYYVNDTWIQSPWTILPADNAGREVWAAYRLPTDEALYSASQVRIRFSDPQYINGGERSGYISVGELRLGGETVKPHVEAIKVNPYYIANHRMGYGFAPQPNSVDIDGSITVTRPAPNMVTDSNLSLYTVTNGTRFGTSASNEPVIDFSYYTQVHIEFERCDVPVSVGFLDGRGYVEPFGNRVTYYPNTLYSAPISISPDCTNMYPLIFIYCVWPLNENGQVVKIKNIWFSGDDFVQPDGMYVDQMPAYPDMTVDGTNVTYKGDYYLQHPVPGKVYEPLPGGYGFTMGAKNNFDAGVSGGSLYLMWDQTNMPDFKTMDTLYFQLKADNCNSIVVETEIYSDRGQWETSYHTILQDDYPGYDTWVAYKIPVNGYAYGSLFDASIVRIKISDPQYLWGWGRNGYISVGQLRLGASNVEFDFATSPQAPIDRTAYDIGMCITETGGWQTLTQEERSARIQLYKDMHFRTVRTGSEWSTYEPVEGSVSAPFYETYFRQIGEEGMRLKLIAGTYSNVPQWYRDKYPSSPMVNDAGESSPNAVSYLSPNLKEYMETALDNIMASWSTMGILDYMDSLVVDMGLANEPIYPAAWTQTPNGLYEPSGPEHFWMYDPYMQADFIETMKEKYGSIWSANIAWGKLYSSWDKVTVPLPNTVTGKMWEDTLTWYRDVKREFMLQQVVMYKAALQKYVPDRDVKLILYIPGSTIRDNEWQDAVNSGSGSNMVKLMTDTYYVVQLAQTYGCYLQYTGAENIGEVDFIQTYLRNNNIAIPLYGENAGGYDVAKNAKRYNNLMMQYGMAGVDYTMANWILNSDGVTANQYFDSVRFANEKLYRYLTGAVKQPVTPAPWNDGRLLDKYYQISSNADLEYTGDERRLADFLRKLENGEEVTVGFIGGSITQGSPGPAPQFIYPQVFTDWLRYKFPFAEIDMINIGVGGTNSMWGVHRVNEELLAHDPDLVIIEYAANDQPAWEELDATYESLTRKILGWRSQPAVLALSMCWNNFFSAQDVQLQTVRHYDIPFVSYRDVVLMGSMYGDIEWSMLCDDAVHPNKRGAWFTAQLMARRLEDIYQRLDDYEAPDYTLPAARTSNLYEDAGTIWGRPVGEAQAYVPVSLGGFVQAPFSSFFDHQNGWMCTAPNPGSLRFEAHAGEISVALLAFDADFTITVDKGTAGEAVYQVNEQFMSTNKTGYYITVLTGAAAGSYHTVDIQYNDTSGMVYINGLMIANRNL